MIVFGFRSTPGNMEWPALEQRALDLELHYGLEFTRFVEGLRKMNRHDEKHLLT